MADHQLPEQPVLARSLHPAALRRGVRAGTLHPLTRGAYLPAPRESEEPYDIARRRAHAQLRAICAILTSDHIFCRESAALAWDLPLWRTPTTVHVIQHAEPGGRGRRDLVRHRIPCTPEEIEQRHGLPVTSIERTVVDCARTLPAPEGLVLADAALRLGVNRGQLATGCVPGARGVVRARAVIEAADDGAESPGESVTRLHLLRHGLPRPDTQIRIDTRRGTFYGDLGWRRWKVLVEFDGRIKYTRLADGDPAHVVYREKLRQEAIEEQGWRVHRVSGADLRDGSALAWRVGRMLPGFEPEYRPGLG